MSLVENVRRTITWLIGGSRCVKDGRRDAAKSSHGDNDNYCGVNDRKLAVAHPINLEAGNLIRRSLEVPV